MLSPTSPQRFSSIKVGKNTGTLLYLDHVLIMFLCLIKARSPVPHTTSSFCSAHPVSGGLETVWKLPYPTLLHSSIRHTQQQPWFSNLPPATFFLSRGHLWQLAPTLCNQLRTIWLVRRRRKPASTSGFVRVFPDRQLKNHTPTGQALHTHWPCVNHIYPLVVFTNNKHASHCHCPSLHRKRSPSGLRLFPTNHPNADTQRPKNEDLQAFQPDYSRRSSTATER